MTTKQQSHTDVQALMEDIGKLAQAASAKLRQAGTAEKNAVLLRAAEIIESERDTIQTENAKDLEAGEAKGLSSAMIDRLRLTDSRIKDMADALRKVVELNDPVGEIYDTRIRPNGLKIARMRAPIGVVGIIFESRPNVTVDAAALCLKSGNAAILRGGSEAIHSNRCLGDLFKKAFEGSNLSPDSVQLVPTTDREAVSALLRMNQYVDIIIPRGGRGLIEKVIELSTIPVIKHLDGNCFIYVDEYADLKRAVEIVVNAKAQRPGVCNAVESLLAHEAIAEKFYAMLVPALEGKGVEIRADEALRAWHSHLKAATDEDWDTEYLDLIVTAGVTDSFDSAIEFINARSSHHTDAILTDSYDRSMKFLAGVDSACVFVNCSTRFSDGGQFGMGCEIGISTDKLHARGPMGLVELTTSKFIAFGDGQIRE